MSQSPTALSSWGLAIAAALEARGVPSQPLFAQAGLDYSALADPTARYSVEATSRLWRLAIEATGDPAFGIAVAREARFVHFHGLGFSLAASGSLREAFQRVLRFFRIVTDAVQIVEEEQPETLRYVAEFTDTTLRPVDEAVDAFAVLSVRVCRALRDRHFNPVAVELRRPEPSDPAPFLRYFRVMPAFGASADALVYDRASFEARLPAGNAELARVNDAVTAEHLARLDHGGLVSRVRKVLVDLLPLGEPSQREVARRLGLSPRSLQRRLADERTSYSDLFEETRFELARQYMADPKYTITEAAYLLGFGTATSFSRAFSRWTGEAPRAYRARVVNASRPPKS